MRHILLAFVASLSLFAGNASALEAAKPHSVASATIKAGTLPTATLTAPANGASLTLGQQTAVQASTYDPSGLARVTFFSGPTQIGVDTSSPSWFVFWTPYTAGSHDIWFASESNSGGVAQSNVARVSVGTVTNPPPSLTLTAPVANQTLALSQPFALTATASDSNGTINSVTFFVGATPLGTDSIAPYSVNWTPTAAGVYSIRAVATDNAGANAASPAATVTVAANTLPAVALTSPTNGATSYVGQAINLTANASDSDGSVAQVNFHANGTLLGSDTSAPFTYTWGNPPSGTHSLTAIAIDNLGGSTTSPAVPVTVNVNASPTVELTAPSNNSGHPVGQPLTLSANAGDDVGVQRVDFMHGTTVLASDTTAPYTASWTPPSSGSYGLRAVVYDVLGAATSSNVHYVNVSAPPTIAIASPAANAVIPFGQAISYTVSTSGPHGVVQVDYFDGATLLSSDAEAPFHGFDWTNAALGSHTLTARAKGGNGLMTTSAAVTIIVTHKPNISLAAAAPAYTIGQTATLTAAASDADGSISKVEFYDGMTLFATDTSAPYTTSWTTAGAPRTIVLTARAYDNYGVSTTSSAVNVEQYSPATVAITVPSGAVTVPSAQAITLAATASNSDNSISKVEFFDGAALIGALTAAPYTRTWSPAAGTHSVTAKATDVRGHSVASSAVSITANTAPTVGIAAPANNSGHAVNQPLTLTANAADSDGTITKVEFFLGATLLGSDTTSPYSLAWTPASNGSYSLSARATDNGGLVAVSSAVSITVGTPPAVALTLPAPNAVVRLGDAVAITATATPVSPSTITKVEFYAGATLLATDTTAPYTYNWTNAAAGAQTLTAKAFDSLGLVTTSSAVAITVNVPPTVSINAPVIAATIGQTVTLTATASDSDGSISKVEFLDGGTVIATDTTAPYTHAWPIAGPPGVHGLQARAHDNRTAATTSNAYALTQHAPATVTLVTPASATTLATGQSMTLNATASNADNSIAKVEFFDGASLLGTDTTSPYGYTWTPSSGAHSVSAKATDTRGFIVATPAVAVTVNAAPTVTLTAPHGGDFLVSTDVTITANASDADGNLARVDFYNGATKIGSDATSPYSHTFAANAAGSMTLSVVAVDALDTSSIANSTTSTSIVVHAAPTVALVTPATGKVYSPSEERPLKADVSDDNGIAKVEFLLGGSAVVQTVTPPEAVKTWTANGAWAGLYPAGTYKLSARVTDTYGRQRTSAETTVIINAPPTVSLTAPAANTRFERGEKIPMSADAGDPEGALSKVEFYTYPGPTKIGEDTSSPYSFEWSGAAQGEHRLQARAIDQHGLEVASNSIDIIVTGPRTALTAPTHLIHTHGVPIPVSVLAITGDFTIARVQYYIDGAAIGSEVTASPFSSILTGLPVGHHDLTAQAFDAAGRRSVPDPIRFTVREKPTVTLRSPVSTATFNQGQSVTLWADVAHASGDIVGFDVYFFDGDTQLAVDHSHEFTYPYEGLPPGYRTIKACVYENGYQIVCDDERIYVNPGPELTMLSPVSSRANQQEYQAFSQDQSIAIAGTAVDPDGIRSISIKVAERDTNPAVLHEIKELTGLPAGSTVQFIHDWVDQRDANGHVITPEAVRRANLFGVQTLHVTAVDGKGAVSMTSFVTVRMEPEPTDATRKSTLATARTACPDNYCVELTGTGFSSQSGVRIGFESGAKRLDFIGPEHIRVDESGTRLEFDVVDAFQRRHMNGDGLNVYVTHPDDLNKWTGPRLVRRNPVTLRFHHTNLQGSVVATTNISGVSMSSTDYMPFGATYGSTGTSSTQLGYTGKWWDPELGLYYYGARFYDPQLSRFLSIDPAEFRMDDLQTLNRYAYVQNNPLVLIDPDGRDPERAYGAAVGWMLADDPEKFAVVMRAEQASTFTGTGAEEGMIFGAALHDLKEIPDVSTEQVVGSMAVAFLRFAVARKMAGGNKRSPTNFEFPSLRNKVRNFWWMTRAGTERVVVHGGRNGFGKIYKSKSDGLWWSKDNAGHGKSVWKVFTEDSKGLHWKADADEYGDFIVGKHKGPTGMFIPWDQLRAGGF